LIYLEDLPLGAEIACGSFSFTRDEIIDFASRYDPQPFHLDDDAADASYFRGLSASGLHTQGAAIGLMVRAIQGVAFIAGWSLHEARFRVPVRADVRYDVTAAWTQIVPTKPERGRAAIRLSARDPDGRTVFEGGVTYVVARRPG
jgi:acyl dehydratase